MTKLHIHTKNKHFPVSEDLYGLFFEDINRAGDGGLYPEMIRNRAFEDSILPDECTPDGDGYSFTSDFGWRAIFNHGEGLSKWVENNATEYTPIPAWYACGGAEITLNRSDTLNTKRLAALDIDFGGGCVYNIGYAGIAQAQGEAYHFYMFAKAVEGGGTVRVSIESAGGEVYGRQEFTLRTGGYARYDAVFTGGIDAGDCRLCLRGEGKIRLGFISLMPADTYNGHGLRRDIVELYKGIRPRFVRFPGGCIVEGFTFGTMNYFRNSIGPVWERPSQYLLWHYRTTNGLGFHEFLQLCEDLGAEALYVCNCGIVCQGRSSGNNYLEGNALRDMLDDAIHAIEYATAPADTQYGAMRAAAGHPEPFRLHYIEIGNENHGPVYNERYAYFYNELHRRYPDMVFVANTHVEDDGLAVDIVDEHFYSDATFFAEQLHHYDGYDRSGPGVFVGELAVNVADTGNLRAAISEAMFFIGMERNQDVVRLASYAPLMENIHFAAWAPNLIAFDNRASYGIPSYYIWKLFGNHRGRDVVEIEEETPKLFRSAKGMPAILGSVGVRFRNARCNGAPVAPAHNVLGYAEPCADGFTTRPGDDAQANMRMMQRFGLDRQCLIVMDGDEETRSSIFEVEILAQEGKTIGVGAFAGRWQRSWYDMSEEQEKREWDFRFVHPYQWIIENGVSRIVDTGYRPHRDLCAPAPVRLREGEYNDLRMEADEERLRVWLNGEFVQEAALPSRQKTAAVVTSDGDALIVKLVNFSDSAENVEISLDCAVEPEYMLAYLSGEGGTVNSIENPTAVHDREERCTGAAQTFTFAAKPYSANVLTLRKK